MAEKKEETELALVPNEDGSYDLAEVKSDAVAEPKEKLKPWKVGVTDKGEDVWAPVAGPNARKVLHLKMDVGVCKGCRCTVHKRAAAVDPWGNVWCFGCWPYGSFTDPRFTEPLPEGIPPNAELPPPKFPALPEGEKDD